jgi:A118 family predicted phage portal protein
MIIQILEKLKTLGYQTVSEDHYRAVDIWKKWYAGHVSSFHDYKVFNGLRHVPCHKVTAGLAKQACEDWADRLMNEKVTVALSGEKEQAFFDRVCDENRFRSQMNRYQELSFALGGGAVVARLGEIAVDSRGRLAGTAGKLYLDFVAADGIFPLSWQGGIIRECAFATEFCKADACYCYLQLHLLGTDGQYVIENHVYRKENENLTEVALSDVPGFTGIAERFPTGSAAPLFVLFRPNIANNLDPDCPLGISVYANAIDQLMTCDNIFDSFNSEFSLGRKRIMVKPEGVRSADGEPYFDPNDLVFYLLPEDAQNESTVQEMQATLRMQEHLTGMEMALSMLAVKCGFSPGHWELDRKQRTLHTATEVISTNSAEFRTLKKHEIVLEEALIALARAILKLGSIWFGLKLNESVEIRVDFDDSIIEDEDTAFDRDMKMLDAGVLTKEEFRCRWAAEQ